MFLNKFFNPSKKINKKNQKLVNKVLELEPVYVNTDLGEKTNEFKKRYQNGESLESMLPEVFAVCREASWRILKLKMYPVQILGGITLHQGNIAEMKTGEGKTLVAVLPAYLNALTGKGVHIVTVNEYLARRDKEQMGKVFEYLGLTTGLILSEQQPHQKRFNYGRDIVYSTNSELGFDYLRDHLVFSAKHGVQEELNFAILDEVDSILIDEARTPLIISSPSLRSVDPFISADKFVKTLKPEDYDLNEKDKAINLTESGVEKADKYFKIENLMDTENIALNFNINLALRANFLLRKDIEYIVRDGKVKIIDQFTGRVSANKVYNDGLHQAVEAKEELEVNAETAVDATITYQNFFRMYNKLAGMTGTALTEADEFREIYNLEPIEIPTNMPMIRNDQPDVVYKKAKDKWKAIVNDIKERFEKGQPVLVGTVNIERSELLSDLLKKARIPHQVLNAKHHEKEALIIAQAGRYKAVTIATNMAGRGTDILLGGNPLLLAENEFQQKFKFKYDQLLRYEPKSEIETANKEKILKQMPLLLDKYKAITSEEKQKVLKAGGLYVIGTERHEARRIDNQLRGRSGRQGDPGESRFYLSLEDDLLRLFGGEKVLELAENLNMGDDVPITHKFLSNIVEHSQKKLECNNFAARRDLLKFDTIINTQRQLIYKDREKILSSDNTLKETIMSMLDQEIQNLVTATVAGSKEEEDWDIAHLEKQVEDMFGIKVDFNKTDPNEEVFLQTLQKALYEKFSEIVGQHEDETQMNKCFRKIILSTVDNLWKAHIDNIAQLKQGIGLRGYGNQDPFIVFQKEIYKMYSEMIDNISSSILYEVFRSSPSEKEEPAKIAS